MAERCSFCGRPFATNAREQTLGHYCQDHQGFSCLRSRIATLEEDLAGEAATSQGSLMVAEQVECRIAKLEAVATEAAAMLTETNHGGLSHARRVSMRKALVAAGVPIPAQCSACPHEEPKPYCECGAPSCEVCHP